MIAAEKGANGTLGHHGHLARLLQRREIALVALILAVFAMVAWVDLGFLSAGNLRDLVVRCAPTVIVGCGLMLVVVTGEIDISVGSLMGWLSAVLGVTLSSHHWDWPLLAGVPAVLGLGALIGAGTGVLVAWGRVPSIIATLGLLTALQGLATWTMGGRNIADLPDSLTRAAKYGFWGMPLSVWVATLVVLTTWTLLYQTPLGPRLFAIGSSQYAASMVGLSERRLKLFVFTYTGFLTAVATVVEVPRLPTIESGIGSGFELLVVTCVVVGGVSIAGGRGTLSGVVLAVVLMTMVRPVLTFLDVGASGEKWTKGIQGGFIILAIVADSLWQRRPLSRRRPPR